MKLIFLVVSAVGVLMFSGCGHKTQAGQLVFQDQCAGCHNADSTDKKVGPGLKGLFHHDRLANGKKLSEENIRARIDEGGSGMPAFDQSLSDDDKSSLIAYLETL